MATAMRIGWAAMVAGAIGGSGPAASGQEAPRSADEAIDAKELRRHIQVLASDEFEGRAPASRGEDLAVGYIRDQFQRLNLKPGNPDGTFVQDVPLIGFQTKATGSIRVGAKTIELKPVDDWVAVSRRSVPEVSVKGSDVVFVGYGVDASEYSWDDYKGTDVEGKTIVMLVNDPPVADPADPSKLDEASFRGRAMTYYGRWTYKYEVASRRGAAAVLLVHETGPAGYPFSVIQGSWTRENFDLIDPAKHADRPAIESWLTVDKARELMAACGQDFDALKKAAATREFRPVDLGAKADFEASNTLREVRSKNVVGKVEGSDPTLRDEYVVYTAHWDHLGRDPKLPGDQIYNGAADNASGVASILEIAEAFSLLNPKPRRSILFLAVTAEEKGLLGAKYYAEHPLYPLEKTVADVNIDVINLWGRTADIGSVGKGNTTLDDLLEKSARRKGRVLKGDSDPEKGAYYRSDHFEFAKVGVPALNAKGGRDFIGRSPDYGQKKADEYTSRDYHKVSDEVKDDWDLSGAVEDLRLLFEVGYFAAMGDSIPEWKPGVEFKARRDAMMSKARGPGR